MKTTNTFIKLFYSIAFATLLLQACTKTDTNEDVKQDTSLEIAVKDNLGNPVGGADVYLYTSETNWKNRINQVTSSLVTDANGKVNFTGLNSLKYYWYAEKDCYNNVNGSVTTTQPITANTKTYVNTIISASGTIKLTSTSSYPYRVYINGEQTLDMNGGTTEYFYNKPVGNYTIRVLQLSGYVLYPTDKTFNGKVECGTTFSITYP